MTKKIKTLIAILMSLTLMLAMTACGPKEEAAEEPVTDTQTEEQTETTDATDATDATDVAEAYDIASNLKESSDGDAKTIDTDHFTLTLPLGETWTYETDSETSITFYNIAGREADCGGRLLSIVAYEPDDTSYEEIPHYSVVGESGGKVYIAEYPSDVQADIEVEEHMEQYQTVYAEVNKIEENAEDSPLVLK